MSHVNNTEWLYEKYAECNKKYFKDELPKDITLRWSERMTSIAGNCKYTVNKRNNKSKFEIAMSSHYHRKYNEEQEAINVLIHEMIHVKYPRNHHGELFKREMARINREFGLNITRYSKGAALVRYKYVCKECGETYERANIIKNYNEYSCRCDGKLTEFAI